MKWIALGFVFALAAPASARPLKDGSPAEVKADFEMICNSIERAGAARLKDPSAKAQRIADYLLSHLVTRQAMHVMQSMGGLPAADKPAALRKAAADAGYRGPCPFADSP